MSQTAAPNSGSIVRLWERTSHHPSLLCAAIKGLGIQVRLAQHLKYYKRHRQHDRANEQPVSLSKWGVLMILSC